MKKHLDEYEDLEIDDSDIFGTLNKLVIKPAMKSFSRIYRQYIASVSNYLITMVAFIIFYELLIQRQLHVTIFDYLCRKEKKRPRAPAAARDIAR